jgi:hypothetical protein
MQHAPAIQDGPDELSLLDRRRRAYRLRQLGNTLDEIAEDE